MLTKAIIQSVDYTKNLCRVRIPLFETASRNVNMIEAEAQFSIVPGIYNSYQVGDIVFIGFEENKIDLPIILGKLFISASAEASAHRGNVSGNSLNITDTAQLPYSTIFNYSQIDQNNKRYNNLNTPKKLADSILSLQQNAAKKYQTVIEVTINDCTYNLYLKTSQDFTYSQTDTTNSLYRFCAALLKSQAENMIIPLDFALVETTETVVTPVEELTNNFIEEDPIINYTMHQALLRIVDINDSIKLEVVIDGVKYELTKDQIKSIKSSALYY
jgi:hypothetical protein